MNEEQIRQLFVDSEVCIDKYFDEHVTKELEIKESLRDSLKIGTMTEHPSIGNLFMPGEDYATNVTLSCPANDIERLYANGGILSQKNKDLEVLAKGWRTAAVGKLGEERYNQLCQELGCDLATAYIEHRLLMRSVDWEVQRNPIRSSADYVAREAKRNSLLEYVSAPTSDLQKYIDKKCVEKYDPSLLEKGTGVVLGSVTDFVLTFPMLGTGSWAKLGKFVAVDVGLGMVGGVFDENEVENNNVSQLMSVAIYGKRTDEFEKIRQESRSASVYSDFGRRVNDELGRKILPSSGGSSFFNVGGNVFQDSFNRMNKFGMPEIPDYTEKLRLDGEMYWAMREKFGPKENTSQDGEQVSEDEKKGAAVQQQPVSGWDNLLNGLGLNGFSDVGKNLGYVFAMLPDLLIGMFTGQTKRLNISDNLMPIAAIFGGMFVKNPILKMLLIGLGGANLLNKAGHEALGHAGMNSDQVRQYKTYPDEVLDRRIKNPVMQGNTLVADIDGQPLVLPVTDMAVDAYEKGALPLNTLSNAVLRAWDKRQMEVAQNYEQGISEEQEIVRSRGIQ
mgnify:CR=1 FL=1